MKMTIYKNAILFTTSMGFLSTSCANLNYEMKGSGRSTDVNNEEANENEEEHCQICSQSMENSEDVHALPCSTTIPHKYHKRCLVRWITPEPSVQRGSLRRMVSSASNKNKALNRVLHEKTRAVNHLSCPICRTKITDFTFLLEPLKYQKDHLDIIQTVIELSILRSSRFMQEHIRDKIINLESKIKKEVQKCNPIDLIQGEENKTLLHWIIKANSTNLLKIFWGDSGILDRTMYFGMVNEDGDGPLHTAISNDNGLDMIDLLVQYGANIDARDRNGETPLHRAVKMYYLSWNRGDQVATRLLEHGADITLENDMGKTPLDLARTLAREMVCAFQLEEDQ